MSKQSYRQYLRSKHWQDTRKKYWTSKLPKTCYSCGCSNKPLDLHHRSYKRVGSEKLNDLLPLCRPCHTATHKKEKETKSDLWGAANRLRRDNMDKNGWWSDGWNRGKKSKKHREKGGRDVGTHQ